MHICQVDPHINYMIEPNDHEPWSLAAVIDLQNRLSAWVPSCETSYPNRCSTEDGPSITGKSSNSLGDFTPIWDCIDLGKETCQDFVGYSESAPSSIASGGLFSDLDSPPTSATEDSDISDIYEAYVTKSNESRSKDQAHGTKPSKKQRRREQEKSSSEGPIAFPEEELEENKPSPPKTDNRSPFPGDHLFDRSQQLRGQKRRHVLSEISQSEESSGLESEVEIPSRLKSATFKKHSSVAITKKVADPYAIHPLLNLTLEEKKYRVVKKLSDQLGIDKSTFFNIKHNSPLSTDPKAVHVFVDHSNIIIGFQQAIRLARQLPEKPQSKTKPPFSFHSLALIMERNRPVAKRVLAGSKKNPEEPPPDFVNAENCGYETNILSRVWKSKYKELALKKVRGGQGNGFLAGRSSEMSSNDMGFQEQGVDEILHMKILETLNDYPIPSTIVLATGDGAEAEYSAGFFKNVVRALEKGWNVELVAWSGGLSFEYRTPAFKQRWRKQFKVIKLDDFSEELLAIYKTHEISAELLGKSSDFSRLSEA